MAKKPTKGQATDAARSFTHYRETNPKTTQSDLLMGLGRLYEFPEGTPKYDGPWRVSAIASFIQAHAVEIE